MDGLIDAVEAYAELPVQHPNELAEFFAGIHRLQDMLATRIARRLYPDAWLDHGDD